MKAKTCLGGIFKTYVHACAHQYLSAHPQGYIQSGFPPRSETQKCFFFPLSRSAMVWISYE